MDLDDDVQAYLDVIPAEHRPLFDRVHRLIVEERPDVVVSMSYGMPTYRAGGKRLHVATWAHGVSLYGWRAEDAGGLLDRHPEVRSGRGTIKLRPGTADAIGDDELRALVRSSLAEDPG